MTIHDTHPFADPDPDPARRLRGRLGGAVSLWTAGDLDDPHGRAGLTITSLMLAAGEPTRLLALVDPDSDLADVVADTGRCVVQLLTWEHRGLAEAFAGTAPAPGGPFRQAPFEQTAWGPRLAGVATWAGVVVESTTPVGWSDLLTCVVEELVVGEDRDPLAHRRGRWLRVDSH